jgi:hypothetical protein
VVEVVVNTRSSIVSKSKFQSSISHRRHFCRGLLFNPCTLALDCSEESPYNGLLRESIH